MWLSILGLLNGILTGVVYSIEELWMGIFFCLVPFAGILLSKNKISGFLTGYGLGYYITGLSFLYRLTDEVPLAFYSSYALLTVAVLGISLYLTGCMWLALYPLRWWRSGGSMDIFRIAALYALAEWLQGAVPYAAFPWFRLAAVAVPSPILIQGASLFGSLFVSFLIMLWNALLARFIMKWKIEAGMLLAAALFLGILLYGEQRLYQTGAEEEYGNTEAAIIQGNHEGSEKWQLESKDILRDYERLIYEYTKESADLIVLPETALPYAISESADTLRTLLTISRRMSADILTGAIQREEKEGRIYNVVYHVTERGLAESVYQKRILVPFGEYLPLASVFGRFCPWLSEYMEGNYFEAGENPVVFDTAAGRAGVLICYESIFPRAAEEAVREGAELLVIVSNDSWFQETPAMREHHAHAVLRAVEQGRYVIRAGNTGISSVIDSRGRVISGIAEGVRGGFQTAVRRESQLSAYTRWGRQVLKICLGIYLLILLRSVWRLIFSKFSDIMKRIKCAG